jgi:hypothetical protein
MPVGRPHSRLFAVVASLAAAASGFAQVYVMPDPNAVNFSASAWGYHEIGSGSAPSPFASTFEFTPQSDGSTVMSTPGPDQPDDPELWMPGSLNNGVPSGQFSVYMAFQARLLAGGDVRVQNLGFYRASTTASSSFGVEIYQTHTWLNGRFQLLGPRLVGSMNIPYGYGGSTNMALMPVEVMIRQETQKKAVGGDQTWLTGMYELRILDNYSGSNTYKFYVSYRTWSTGGGGTDDDGDGIDDGSTGGDPNDENSNTEGFWESLFVPDQQSMDDMRNSFDQFRGWGPFGVAAELGEEMNNDTPIENGTLGVVGCRYCIPLGSTAWTGPIVADLTPYASYVGLGRVILLAISIWGFGWSLFRWASRSKSQT